MKQIITEEKTSDAQEGLKPFEALPGRKKNLSFWLEKVGYLKAGVFLGLDIGSATVKMAQLEKTPKGWELVKASSAQISSIAERKEEENLAPLVVRTIRHMLKKEKIKIDRVVTSVSGDGVKQRFLKIPKMKEKELFLALSWEAKKLVNWPAQPSVLDYLITLEKENQIEVLLVVAKKRVIEEQISLIKACGLKPLAIETNSLALNSALFLADEKETQKNSVLLDLGVKSTLLNISQNKILRFCREINMGGDDLTYTIAHHLGCDLVEAEELKKEVGLELKKESPEKEQKKLIRGLISDQMEKLVNEIGRSLDYFRAEYPGENLEKIWLCGGGAKLKGLDRFLEDKFKRKVEIFDPLKFILGAEDRKPFPAFWRGPSEKGISPDLTLALGLATWRKK